MVLGTVVKAYHRRSADGIADEGSGEDHAHVHHHAIGCHPVFSGVAQQLDVVEHSHQIHGHIAHKLRRAVDTGTEHHSDLKIGFSQPQEAGIFTGEVDQRHGAAHHLTHGRCHGSTGQLVFLRQQDHQHRIQNHIGKSGGHCDDQPQPGLFCRDEKGLKQKLQSGKGQSQQEDPSIEDRILQHLPLRTQTDRHRPQKGNAQHCQHDTKCCGYVDEKGKVGIGPFGISFAEGSGHNGTAAGAEHEAHGGQKPQKGHDQIDGGEGGLAGEIGYKEPVYHAVYGHENHHADGGQGKLQQTAVSKMVG